jgi:hypothetical protein
VLGKVSVPEGFQHDLRSTPESQIDLPDDRQASWDNEILEADTKKQEVQSQDASEPNSPQSQLPALTSDEFHEFMRLTRSLDSYCSFSVHAVKFATGKSEDDAQRFVDHWYQAGLILSAGWAHGMDLYCVPKQIRDEVKKSLKGNHTTLRSRRWIGQAYHHSFLPRTRFLCLIAA